MKSTTTNALSTCYGRSNTRSRTGRPMYGHAFLLRTLLVSRRIFEHVCTELLTHTCLRTRSFTSANNSSNDVDKTRGGSYRKRYRGHLLEGAGTAKGRSSRQHSGGAENCRRAILCMPTSSAKFGEVHNAQVLCLPRIQHYVSIEAVNPLRADGVELMCNMGSTRIATTNCLRINVRAAKIRSSQTLGR